MAKGGSRNFSLRDFSFAAFAGAMGYGLLIGWQTVMVWSIEIIDSSFYSDFDAHFFRAIFLGIVSLSLLLFSRISHHVAGRNRVVGAAILSSFCTLSAPFAMHFNIQIVPAAVAWGLAGLGDAILLSFWCHYTASLNQKQSLLAAGGAFLIAGVTFLLFAALQSGVRLVFAAFMPIASFLCCLPLLGEASKRVGQYHENVDMQPEKRSSYAWEKSFSMVCNVLVGFSASCLTSSLFSFSPSVFIGIALTGSGIASLLVLMKAGGNVTLRFLVVLAPCMAVQLFAFSFGDERFQVFAATGVFFFMSCFEILSTSSLSRKTRYLFPSYGKALMRYRAHGRMVFCVGWLVGLVSVSAREWRPDALEIVSFMLFGMLSAAISLAIYRSTLETRDDRGKIKSIARALHDAWADGSEDGSEKSYRLAFARIAEEFGLTSREQEVLSYLARGRDVGYIAEVFTVSVNTVRSHVYSIYSKMGVHSRRELIDAVELRFGEEALIASGDNGACSR